MRINELSKFTFGPVTISDLFYTHFEIEKLFETEIQTQC
jgi:hypothetical protein